MALARSPRLQLVATFLGIGIFFAVPDLASWVQIDRLQTPVRAPMGDFDQYLTRLKRLQVEGRVGDSVFTWEHRDARSTFVLFDGLISRIPGFGRVPPLWWLTILKSFAVTVVFGALYGLLRIGGADRRLAYFFALVSVLLYGPYALAAPGVASWFLPPFLMGLVPVAWAMARSEWVSLWLGASVFLLLLSAFHPIYFAAGVGVGILWWCYVISRRGSSAGVWTAAALWLGALLLLLFAFYRDYLHVFTTATTAAGEFIERHAALRIRFLHFPLLSLRFLLAGIVGWFLYRRDTSEGRSARFWLLPAFLGIAAFVGVTQNLVSGFSYLGDHFLVLEEFVVLPMAGVIIARWLRGEGQQPSSPGQRALGAGVLILAVLLALGLVVGRSLRGYLVVGRWIPLLVGYATVGFAMLAPKFGAALARRLSRYLPLLAALAALYAGLWFWRSYVYAKPEHLAAQRYRPVFAELSRLERGVVMAPYELSELTALYTPQRVYWSNVNGQQAGSYAELYARLLDQSVVFRDDLRLGARIGKFSVYGTADIWCGSQAERFLYQPLREIGLLNVTLCNSGRSDREWPLFLERRARVLRALDQGSEWRPAYRLDWLVVDRRRPLPSAGFLDRYFSLVAETAEFQIYRYKGSPSSSLEGLSG